MSPMLDERFVIIGAVFVLIASSGYAIETLKGTTQPNRVSWFIWMLAPFVAFSAEIVDGVGLRSLTTLVAGLGPLLVLVASFANRRSYWKISHLDVVCGGLSVLALLLWKITNTGDVAIAFSIATDVLAAVPTIIKSYRCPQSESYVTYLCSALSAGITLLTVSQFTFSNVGFPTGILIIGTALTVLIRFPHSFGRVPSSTTLSVKD